MKKLLSIMVFLASLSVVAPAYSGEYVSGYTRRDGTYVAPHYRSSPNDTVRDNYDLKGNYNPYTGKQGTDYYKSNPTSPYYDGSRQNND